MAELWLKTICDLSEFDRLLEFLTTRGRPVRVEKFESHELTDDGRLCLQKFDGFTLVLMKHGDAGELHNETEIRCRDGDFDHCMNLFSSLGYFPCTVWKTTRHLIDWENCMIYLDNVEDFGVVVEIKTYAQLQDKSETLSQAHSLFSKLKVPVLSKEAFEQKIQEFRSKK